MSIQTFASLANEEGLTPQELAAINAEMVRGSIDPSGGDVCAVHFWPTTDREVVREEIAQTADTIAANEPAFAGAAVGVFGPMPSSGFILGVVQAP